MKMVNLGWSDLVCIFLLLICVEDISAGKLMLDMKSQ